MKVVTGDVMQAMDRRAITEFGIPGLTLMERAGRGCADDIVARFGSARRRNVVVVAGKGNNGGDGFVVARILSQEGWSVKTLVLARREEIGGDASANLALLDGTTLFFCPEQHQLQAYIPDMEGAGIIVDAIFGTGLTKTVRGIHAAAVDLINAAGAPVVAVDIPSGIDAGSGEVLGVAVKAVSTVTFALAKLGHVLFPGAQYCGDVHVVDIGLPHEVMEEAPGYEFLDRETAASLIRRRDRTEHKGTRGHALIVGGSTGKSGAAAMAANSAVRAGAGLVTAAVPAGIHPVMEVKTTEAMTVPLPETGGLLDRKASPLIQRLAEAKNSLAVGPGIGWSPETVSLVRQIVSTIALPLVLDADALNAVSEDPAILLAKKSSVVILTPHPGEMARLTGVSTAAIEADRVSAARGFALRYGVFLVLKGARTLIAAPDGSLAVNGSGNPGMATGGMGDVLTGILAALLAQGYDPFAACRLGVFLHGHAADLVAATKGEIGMSASDVQEALPYACNDLLGEQVPTRNFRPY